MTGPEMICGILGGFAGLGVACAVWVVRRRGPWDRPALSCPPADPFAHAYGDATGYSAEQLREIARGFEARIARDPLRRSFARFPPQPGDWDWVPPPPAPPPEPRR